MDNCVSLVELPLDGMIARVLSGRAGIGNELPNLEIRGEDLVTSSMKLVPEYYVVRGF